MQTRQYAIRRAAFGGKTTLAHFGNHGWVGVADTMPDAGLFERWCNGPDFSVCSGKFGGDVEHHF